MAGFCAFAPHWSGNSSPPGHVHLDGVFPAVGPAEGNPARTAPRIGPSAALRLTMPALGALVPHQPQHDLLQQMGVWVARLSDDRFVHVFYIAGSSARPKPRINETSTLTTAKPAVDSGVAGRPTPHHPRRRRSPALPEAEDRRRRGVRSPPIYVTTSRRVHNRWLDLRGRICGLLHSYDVARDEERRWIARSITDLLGKDEVADRNWSSGTSGWFLWPSTVC